MSSGSSWLLGSCPQNVPKMRILERINELSENLTKLVSADQSKHIITIRANNQERHHVSTCLVRYAGGGRRQGLVAAVLGQAESVSAEPPTRSAESSRLPAFAL